MSMAPIDPLQTVPDPAVVLGTLAAHLDQGGPSLQAPPNPSEELAVTAKTLTSHNLGANKITAVAGSKILHVELQFTEGRPTEVRLTLKCGLVLGGLRVWRTSSGPRLIYPRSGAFGSRLSDVFVLPRTLRDEWEREILLHWRRELAIRAGVSILASWKKVA